MACFTSPVMEAVLQLACKHSYIDATYLCYSDLFCLFQLGSWAGNLMMKYTHKGFVSDVFVLLECIGASVLVCKYAFLSQVMHRLHTHFA